MTVKSNFADCLKLVEQKVVDIGSEKLTLVLDEQFGDLI
jgi:hypothetical protein